MIYTVTLNPAIDKTIQVARLEKGTLNRVQNSLINIGGKGINVSFVLKALEEQSVALGLAGGKGGRQIREGLLQEGITSVFLETSQEIRTNIKIMENDGTLTELNETGVEIPVELVDSFIQIVEARIGEGDILILSGSVPKGVPKTIYRDLIELAHRKGAKAILDADGELFTQGVEAGPEMVKPNYEEFLRYAGISRKCGEDRLIAEAKKLFEKGISHVILSAGKDGAYFLDARESSCFYCPALQVEVSSTVGAGDAMVAAWACALARGYENEKAMRLSIAASAAAVTTPGTMPPVIEKVQELERKVKWVVRKI